MTDCPRADIRDALPEWVHGRLDASAAAPVASHVAGCDVCAAEAELLRELNAALVPAPAIDASRIAAAVREARDQRRARHRRPPVSWRAAAGALAVAASIVGVLLAREYAGTGESDTARVASAETARGARAEAAGGSDSSAPALLAADTPRARAGSREATRAPAPARAELMMGGGIGDLVDSDLELLLQRLESVDALPRTTPEPVIPTTMEGRAST
jgi:hypothetical protein